MSRSPEDRASIAAQDEWRLIEELVDEVLGRPQPERSAWLLERCAGRDQLRREVEAILALGEAESPLLDRPLFEARPELAEELGETLAEVAVGRQFGAWEIASPIGSGGMGRVFEARRVDGAFEKQGALKILRWEFAEQETIRRFERERQILADLDHPGIARLLDGGVTENGLPWLVMEKAEGVPLDRCVSEYDLDLDQRLRVFEAMCRAVQYAHGRLVIHRDLKPSNVLVSADGAVKLLDFGIARLLDTDPQTRTENAPMTLPYAAPEQIGHGEISTATDVWALGVLLYQFLVGALPWRASGGAALIAEITSARVPVPSVELESRDRALASRVRGDLDSIVGQALHQDPEQRYASAGEFAQDLARLREGLPIQARPPTLSYVVSRYVRRHRIGVALALGAATLLTALVVLFTVRLSTERDRALRSAERADQVRDFLIGLFEANNPKFSPGEEVTARQLLDEGDRRLDEDLAEQPQLRSQIKQVVARLYYELGDYEQALARAEQAVATARTHAASPTDLAAALAQKALVLTETGRYEAAEEASREALALQRAATGSRSPAAAKAMNDLGFLLANRGAYEEAIALLREAADLQGELLGTRDAERARTLSNLGLAIKWSGDFATAEPLYREALDIFRVTLEPGDPAIATQLDNLGVLLGQSGRLEESEEVMQEALAMRRSTLGESHPDVALNLNNLGALYRMKGEYALARDHFSRALEANRRHFGDDSLRVATNSANLASIQVRLGDFEEARRNHERALELRRRGLGDEHIEVALSLDQVALLDRRAGNLAQALERSREAVRVARQVAAPASSQRAHIESTLGWVLLDMNRSSEALEVLDAVALATGETLPADHPTRLKVEVMTGIACARLGEHDRATALLGTALDGFAARNPDDPRVAEARSWLEAHRAGGVAGARR